MVTEDRLQQICYTYFHNNYPNLRGLLYHNYNNPPNAIQGKRLKSLGLVTGVADLTLLFQCKTYFFELKTEKGKQSQRQRDWENQVAGQGFDYVIIRSFEEFKKNLHNIVGKPK